MKKTFAIIILSASVLNRGLAQNTQIDSLRHQLTIVNDDTSRALIMVELSLDYQPLNSDSGQVIAQRAIKLSQQINFPKGEVKALISLAGLLTLKGDLPQALELDFRSLKIAEDNHLLLYKSICLINIGDIFWDQNDFPRSISFYQQAARINEMIKNEPRSEYWRILTEEELGAAFMLNNQYDSAFSHLQKTYNETINDKYWHPSLLMFLGDLQFRMNKRNEGLSQLRQSIDLLQKNNDRYYLAYACRLISECFREMNLVDSCIYYAKRSLVEAQLIGFKSPILYTSRTLAELYESKDIRKSLYYHKVYDTANDLYYGPSRVNSLQKTLSDEQERQRKLESARLAYQNSVKLYSLLAGSGILLLIGVILYRNNVREKKSRNLLREKNKAIEQTLSDLRSAQAQLIQSEKMASLGELTAGIAHEIQNPLNFVNNFSEVNKDLLEEMKGEIEKGNFDEVKSITIEIINNEEKITHHGKRADAIVKGMLQHSQTSTGNKELTDINALADEYLRLSYHGLRAKDKLFNPASQTNFDISIGKISIVPQEIGRVLLNLYNNAFYAMNEKKSALSGSASNLYEPAISVSTKRQNNKISISVKDNGNGIPQKMVDKIFQPFFTTKPTGQGTGLGLSLAYDIVKAHGGELRVVTNEARPDDPFGRGEGAEFIILLPV